MSGRGCGFCRFNTSLRNVCWTCKDKKFFEPYPAWVKPDKKHEDEVLEENLKDLSIQKQLDDINNRLDKLIDSLGK